MFKPNLAPNEFCYAFKVVIDKTEWFKRIEEVELEKASPPEIAKLKNISLNTKSYINHSIEPVGWQR